MVLTRETRQRIDSNGDSIANNAGTRRCSWYAAGASAPSPYLPSSWRFKIWRSRNLDDLFGCLPEGRGVFRLLRISSRIGQRFSGDSNKLSKNCRLLGFGRYASLLFFFSYLRAPRTARLIIEILSAHHQLDFRTTRTPTRILVEKPQCCTRHAS